MRAREDVRSDLMRARHGLSKLLLCQGLRWQQTAWTGAHEAWLRALRFERRGVRLASRRAWTRCSACIRAGLGWMPDRRVGRGRVERHGARRSPRSQTGRLAVPPEIAYFNTANLSPQLHSVRAAGVAALDRRGQPWAISADDWFTEAERLRTLFEAAQGRSVGGQGGEGVPPGAGDSEHCC